MYQEDTIIDSNHNGGVDQTAAGKAAGKRRRGSESSNEPARKRPRSDETDGKSAARFHDDDTGDAAAAEAPAAVVDAEALCEVLFEALKELDAPAPVTTVPWAAVSAAAAASREAFNVAKCRIHTHVLGTLIRDLTAARTRLIQSLRASHEYAATEIARGNNARAAEVLGPVVGGRGIGRARAISAALAAVVGAVEAAEPATALDILDGAREELTAASEAFWSVHGFTNIPETEDIGELLAREIRRLVRAAAAAIKAASAAAPAGKVAAYASILGALALDSTVGSFGIFASAAAAYGKLGVNPSVHPPDDLTAPSEGGLSEADEDVADSVTATEVEANPRLAQIQRRRADRSKASVNADRRALASAFSGDDGRAPVGFAAGLGGLGAVPPPSAGSTDARVEEIAAAAAAPRPPLLQALRISDTIDMVTALSCDTDPGSPTAGISAARVAAAKLALWYVAQARTKCHESVVMIGDTLYSYMRDAAATVNSRLMTGAEELEDRFEAATMLAAADRALIRGLSGVFTTGPRGVGGESTAVDDMSTAAALDSFMRASSYADTTNQMQLIAMILPMVSPERFTVRSAEWHDIGRAFASALRTQGELSLTGRAQWITATARKLFLSRAREWVVAGGLEGATGGALSPGKAASVTERQFIRRVFLVDSPALRLIRAGGGEAEELFESRADVTVDALESLYANAVDTSIDPNAALLSVVADPFERLFATFFYELVSTSIGRSRRALPRARAGVATVAAVYCAFRNEYRATMQSIHSQALFASRGGGGRSAMNLAVNRVAVRVNGGAAAEADRVDAAIKRAPPRGDTLAAEVDAAVNRDTEVAAAANAHTQAVTAIASWASPHDFQWSTTHEVNAALNFLHSARASHIIAAAAKSEAAALKAIYERHPALSAAARDDEALKTPDGVGAFIVELAALTSQEAINLVISDCLETIELAEVHDVAVAAWAAFETEKPRITARTLGGYAKIDSPAEFSRWHRHWSIAPLIAAVQTTAARPKLLSEYTARSLWLQYICEASLSSTGSSSAQFYRMSPGTHYLRPISGLTELSGDVELVLGESLNQLTRIWTENVAMFDAKYKAAQRAADQVDEERMKSVVAKTKDLLKEVAKITEFVHSERGRSAIIAGVRTSPTLACHNFSEVKNNQEDLMAFLNGVMDFGGTDERGATFRAGKLEDAITLNTHMHLPWGGWIKPPANASSSSARDVYSWDHAAVVETLEYLSQVFPDDELRDYAILDLAHFLVGGNKEKLFRMWSGNSNNSKSILIKIMQKLFGDYAFDMPTEVLCTSQHRDASAPSPELAQAAGRRVGFLSEPSSRLEIDVGMMKKYTGNDSFFARTLHDKGGSQKAQFRLVFQCNNPPRLQGLDEASQKRFLVLPFPATFVRFRPGEEPTLAEQRERRVFKMDENFDRRIPTLARALAWILFHKYPEVRARAGREIPRPEIVNRVISEYIDRVDVFSRFQAENLAAAPPGNAVVLTVSKLLLVYRNWAQQEGIVERLSKNAMGKSDLEMHLRRASRLGPCDVTTAANRGWTRWVLSPEAAGGAVAVAGGGGAAAADTGAGNGGFGLFGV